MGMVDELSKESMEASMAPSDKVEHAIPEECVHDQDATIMIDYVRASYNAALSDCARSKNKSQWQTAISLLEDMKSHGVSMDTLSYNAAMTACGLQKQWGPAAKLITDMRSKGVPPNAATYSVAISICGKTNQWAEALRMFDEMSTRGIKPRSSRIYMDILYVCEKNHLWSDALKVLQDMSQREAEPDAKSYARALGACTASGKWSEALGLLSEMEERGFKPPPASIRATIDVCEHALQWQAAFHLKEQLSPEERAALPAVGLQSSGLADKHKDSVSNLTEVAPSSAVDTKEAAPTKLPPPPGLWKAPMQPPPGQWKVPQPLPSPPGQWNVPQPRPEHEVTKLQSRALANEVRTAIGSFESALQHAENACSWATAAKLLEEMRRPDLRLDVGGYQAAIKVCAKGHQWQHALDILQMMPQEKANMVSERVYKDVVNACAQSQQWRHALEVMQKMPKSSSEHKEFVGRERIAPRPRARESQFSDRDYPVKRYHRDSAQNYGEKKNSSKTRNQRWIPLLCSAGAAGALALLCAQYGLLEGDMTELVYWTGVVGLATYAVSNRSRA